MQFILKVFRNFADVNLLSAFLCALQVNTFYSFVCVKCLWPSNDTVMPSQSV